MRIRIALFAMLVGVLLMIAPSLTQSAKLSDGSYITGVVRSPNVPIRSVSVVVSQGSYQKGRSLTGDDGRYYIEGLDDGAYEVVVMRGNVQLFRGQVYLPKDRIYNIAIR